jgi:hypothetical protein
LPVEIAPSLGLNFQVHPPLTEWSLETPCETVRAPGRVLLLADLTLRFDAAANELRLHSSDLGRTIEPVHLGFLRDLNLPDPLLLLLALSPRIRDETLAERADLYNLLDHWDFQSGRPLRPYRPRLVVGRLVLERARWATPIAEIPVQHPRESRATFFRRLARWRIDQGLPERGFARCVGPHAAGPATPRFYLDWQSPLTLARLRRLFGDVPGSAPQGWLMMTELLPPPEAALMKVNGRPHVSELLIQFAWVPSHG